MPAVLLILTVALYLWTMPHTVTLEDSGIFILTSHFFGIAQPSGYPLYTLLSGIFEKPFTWISISPAVAMSLFSIASALGTLYVLYKTSCVLTKDAVAAFITAAVLIPGTTFWYLSIVAEVYMLNAFFISLAVYSSVMFVEKDDVKYLYLLGFAAGLGLSTHPPLFVLSSAPLLIYISPSLRRMKDFRPLFMASAIFFAGLLPYIHLFTAVYYSDFLFLDPVPDMAGLYTYVFRKNYTLNDAAQTWSFGENLKFALYFIKLLLGDYFLAVIGLPAGLYIAFRQRRYHLTVALISGFIATPVVLMFLWRVEFNSLTVDIYRYFQLSSHLYFALILSFAVKYAVDFIRKQKFSVSLKKKLAFLDTAWVFLILPLGLAVYHYPSLNLKNDTFADQYAKLVLDSLPPDSTLIASEDHDTGPLGYVHYIEKYRPDVKLSNQGSVLYPEKIYKSEDSNDLRILKTLNYIGMHHAESRRIFTVDPLRIFAGNFPYILRPAGPVFEIIDPKDPAPLPPHIILERNRIEKILDEVLDSPFRNWIYHRNSAVNDLCRALSDYNLDHRIFHENRECMLMKAQIFNAHFGKYREADDLFLYYIAGTPDEGRRYRAEELNGARQFLINRLAILRTEKISKEEGLDFIQNAVDLTTPFALGIPFCNNTLAKNLFELKSQLPVILSPELVSLFRGCSFEAQ